jgi:hypothetical protein
VYRVFRPDVGIPILFQHPVRLKERSGVDEGA